MPHCIMIQGTMSGVGKSLLCAGLCRIFHQDGYRTAPFKSQNMALNSYVTPDGLEIGRAQAMQAMAAGIEPDIRMNPILLKPTTDTGSQVIVNGIPTGNMDARRYFAAKRDYLPGILDAYHSLQNDYEIIVIEGAGSPAEINLKNDDIVNMGLAAAVDAPVLLVGNIDPGGVFAQLYGTVMLLEPQERQRIHGLVINKFRGDESLLEPGLVQISALTGKRVLGCIPYMDVHLEEEDSMAPELRRTSRKQTGDDADIAVIRFPRISNFTDLEPLEYTEGLCVRYVSDPRQLGHPDALILPGSKNTLADRQWLSRRGLEPAIAGLVQDGTPVIGICGGYQILGDFIRDPYGTEGAPAEGSGLGFLPVATVMDRRKTLRRDRITIPSLEGCFAPLSGCPVEGYEIHNGVSTCTDGSCGEAPAVMSCDNVMGTYVHGFFESAKVRRALLRIVGKEGNNGPSDWQSFREQQFDLLADTLRRHLDMDRICSIAGI